MVKMTSACGFDFSAMARLAMGPVEPDTSLTSMFGCFFSNAAMSNLCILALPAEYATTSAAPAGAAMSNTAPAMAPTAAKRNPLIIAFMSEVLPVSIGFHFKGQKTL